MLPAPWCAIPAIPLGDCWMDWTPHLTSSTPPPPFHFKHPVYFFQEMDLVDWIIFAVGRLTVRLETKWTPKSISNGEQQQVSSCIAGIGFVIEKWNGAGGWVGGGEGGAIFIADDSLVLLPAMIVANLKVRSPLIWAPFSFNARNSIKVSPWKVGVISTRWFMVFKWGRHSHLFLLSLRVKQPWNCLNNSV